MQKLRIDQEKLMQVMFDKFALINDSKRIEDLNPKINQVREKYTVLNSIVFSNPNDREYSSVEFIRKFDFNGCKYIVICKNIWEYIFINLNTGQCLSKSEILKSFDKMYLKHFFGIFTDFRCLHFDGNIKALNDFYEANKEIFSSKNNIDYTIMLDEIANIFANLNIGLNNNKTQILVRAPGNRFLNLRLIFDENLELIESNYPLNPSSYAEIKDIKIPYEVLPSIFLTSEQIEKGNRKRLSLYE